MTFQWPGMLFSLALVPLLVAAYLRLQRRRQALAARFGRWGRDQAAQRGAPSFRRHLPPALGLLSVVILLLALARPHAEVSLPRVEGTVMLVIDVSGSMAATDAEPTRLEAAQASARAFVQSQPETVQIGIVSFSGSGFVVQAPTHDTARLLATIDRLAPQAGTSLGQGILVALHTLAEDAGLAPAAEATTPPDAGAGEEPQARGRAENELLTRLPAGPYPASLIVLFSDGENTESMDPRRAAEAAAERDVRIDALGFGTTAGTILNVDGYRVHTALDEAALGQIARLTGGAYYNLSQEPDPQVVYDNLSPQWVVKPEQLEITPLLAGAGLLVLLSAAVFSMAWFRRLP